MKRPKIDMSWEVFHRSLEWAKLYHSRGTQREISIHGLGESTLHPDFIEMMRQTKAALPNTKVQFSTNGISFTEEMAIACKELSVRVFISLHRPEKAIHAIELCKKYNLETIAHANFATSSFNWAGQVDYPSTAAKTPCAYLGIGRAVILSDGDITTCCVDTEKEGIIGNVFNPIQDIQMKPYKLCETCAHQIVP